MVTPLEKFLAKHPAPSGMDSKEWAALSAVACEDKFFSSKQENKRLLGRLYMLIKDYLSGDQEVLPNGEDGHQGRECRGLFQPGASMAPNRGACFPGRRGAEVP